MNGDRNNEGLSRIFKSSLTAAVSSKEISNSTSQKIHEYNRQASLKESQDEAESESADKIISQALKVIGNSACPFEPMKPIKQFGRGRGRGRSQSMDMEKVIPTSRTVPSVNVNLKEKYETLSVQSSNIAPHGQQRTASVTELIPSKLVRSGDFHYVIKYQLPDSESTSDGIQVESYEGSRSHISKLKSCVPAASTVSVSRKDHHVREEFKSDSTDTQESPVKESRSVPCRQSLEGSVTEVNNHASKDAGKARGVFNHFKTQKPFSSQACSSLEKPKNLKSLGIEPPKTSRRVINGCSKDCYKGHAKETMCRSSLGKAGANPCSCYEKKSCKQNFGHHSHENIFREKLQLRHPASVGRVKKQSISNRLIPSSDGEHYSSQTSQVYENTSFARGDGLQKVEHGFMSLKALPIENTEAENVCKEDWDLDCIQETTEPKLTLVLAKDPGDLYTESHPALDILTQGSSCREQSEVVITANDTKGKGMISRASIECIEESAAETEKPADKILKHGEAQFQENYGYCKHSAEKSFTTKLQGSRQEAELFDGEERLQTNIVFCKDEIIVSSELKIQPQSVNSKSYVMPQMIVAPGKTSHESSMKKSEASSIFQEKINPCNRNPVIKSEKTGGGFERKDKDSDCKMKSDERDWAFEKEDRDNFAEEKDITHEGSDLKDRHPLLSKDATFKFCDAAVKEANSFGEEHIGNMFEDDMYAGHDCSDSSAAYETCDTTQESDENYTLAMQYLNISSSKHPEILSERTTGRSGPTKESEILSQPFIIHSYSDTEISKRKLREKETNCKPFASSHAFAERHNNKNGPCVESSHTSDICSKSSSDMINSTFSEISSDYHPDICSQSELERSPQASSILNKEENATGGFPSPRSFRHLSQSPDHFSHNQSKDQDLPHTPTEQVSESPNTQHHAQSFHLGYGFSQMPRRICRLPAAVVGTTHGLDKIIAFIKSFSSDIDDLMRNYGESPPSLDAVISISLNSHFTPPFPPQVPPQTNFYYPPKHYGSTSAPLSSSSASLPYPPPPYWHMKPWPELYYHNMGASVNETARFGPYNPDMAFHQNLRASSAFGNGKGCVPPVVSAIEGGFHPWVYPYPNSQTYPRYVEQVKGRLYPVNPGRDYFQYCHPTMATDSGDNIKGKCYDQEAEPKEKQEHQATEKGKCGDAPDTAISYDSKSGDNTDREQKRPQSSCGERDKITGWVMDCQSNSLYPQPSMPPSKVDKRDDDAKTEYVKQASVSSFLTKEHLTNYWNKAHMQLLSQPRSSQETKQSYAGTKKRPADSSPNSRRIISPVSENDVRDEKAENNAETCSAPCRKRFIAQKNEHQGNLYRPVNSPSDCRRIKSQISQGGAVEKGAGNYAETSGAPVWKRFVPARNIAQSTLLKSDNSPLDCRRINPISTECIKENRAGNYTETSSTPDWKRFTPVRNTDNDQCNLRKPANSPPNYRKVDSPVSPQEVMEKGEENQMQTTSALDRKRFENGDEYNLRKPVKYPEFVTTVTKIHKPRIRSTESIFSRQPSPSGTSYADMILSKVNTGPSNFAPSRETANEKVVSNCKSEISPYHHDFHQTEMPRQRKQYERGASPHQWYSPTSPDSVMSFKFYQNINSPTGRLGWMKQQVSEWAQRFVARSKTYQHKFIDTHCHIDMLFSRMGVDQHTTFKNFREKLSDFFPVNFEGCVAVFCHPKTFASHYPKDSILQTVANEDGVWLAVGCHPKSATEFRDGHELGLRHILRHPKVVALGEIGLDYSGTFERHADVQKRVFRQQLRIAMDMKLPLVIHCRDADDDCLEILKEEVPSDHKIHAHCFTRDITVARRWMTPYPNLFLGLTPVISYKSAHGAANTALEIPLDRLLLETDAPYFVPGSIKSGDLKFSFPGFALYTAEVVADIKGISVDTVLKACRENTYKMYGI